MEVVVLRTIVVFSILSILVTKQFYHVIHVLHFSLAHSSFLKQALPFITGRFHPRP